MITLLQKMFERKVNEVKPELQVPHSKPQQIFKRLIDAEIEQIKKDIESNDALGMDQYAFHPGEDNKVYVDDMLYDVLLGQSEYGFGKRFAANLESELHKAGYYLENEGAGVWIFANESVRESKKKIEDYKVGDFIFWKSHEGINGDGSGKVIDVWKADDGKWFATAKNSYETVSLMDGDLR